MGLNSERIGRDNLSFILRRVHVVGPQSRSDLTSLLGLNRTTIGSLVRQLESRSLVEEQQMSSSGLPGRPSHVVRVRSDAHLVLALEIQVDSMAVGLFGLGGSLVRSRRIASDPREVGPDETIAQLLGAAREFITDDDRDRIVGVGVGVVGLVRSVDGVVRLGPNLGWTDVPLGAMVRSGLGLDVNVRVGNEADLGGLAEYLRGAARGIDDAIYVSGEVGLGGGIIVKGQLLAGAHGFAGEIGHAVVNPTGMRCACGATGCWETEVGEQALLRAAGITADGNPRRAVNQILEAAASGQPVARAAVEHVGRWLGIGLSSFVNAFNPGVVVFGGLFGRLEPLVEGIVWEELERRALLACRENLAIRPGRYGIDAALYGAAELAFEPLLADPTLAPARGPQSAGSSGRRKTSVVANR
jgi:predicted NBD/HSP70 family sugar kinase